MQQWLRLRTDVVCHNGKTADETRFCDLLRFLNAGNCEPVESVCVTTSVCLQHVACTKVKEPTNPNRTAQRALAFIIGSPESVRLREDYQIE
jgi:hypothetical protein